MDHRPGNGTPHRLFQVAVVVKGIDGVLEFIGGVLLLFVSPTALHRLVVALTQHELAEEPDDWLVMTLRHLAESFSVETRHFASAVCRRPLGAPPVTGRVTASRRHGAAEVT